MRLPRRHADQPPLTRAAMRREQRSRRRRATYAVAFGTVVLGVVTLLLTSSWGRSSDRLIQACRPTGAPTMRLGITHTQHSWDIHDRTRDTAAKLLSARPVFQAQHLMGWGSGNPEPSLGRYDFTDLDRRFAMIRATGGEPVLILAGAPDWMKGGASGSTDWSKIEVPPTKAHYADFARLAVVTAKRYPQVRHFIVWSELKGFWSARRNNWDIAGYTALYNTVYRALKAVDPGYQVGGPYLVAQSWSATSHFASSVAAATWGSLDIRVADAMDYWLTHKVGADMVVIDGPSASRDLPWPRDPGRATAKFSDVTRWLRGRTDLPVWWAEVYASPDSRSASPQATSRLFAQAVSQLAGSGAAVALLWRPQYETDEWLPGLWNGHSTRDPGSLTPLGVSWPRLVDQLTAVPECRSTP